MSWVRLDDQFPNHAKIISINNDSFRLHITAMCWSASQLTDGWIPLTVSKQIGWFCDNLGDTINELVSAGLWDIGKGGWTIHDYLDYNPSKEQVTKERNAARERMANKRDSSREVRANIPRTSDEVHLPPTPSPSSSSSATETGTPTLADVIRLFTERFFETFGQHPPIQTSGDDGTLAKLITAGLTLHQIDHAIASSLDSFSPTNYNPYPKTWRYCLPAMQRTMDPPKSKPSNGHDPTIRKSNVPGLTPAEQAAADARQEAYERQMAEDLARAGMLK